MQRLTTLILMTLLYSIAAAQDNYKKFKQLMVQKDTTKINALIAGWEKNNPEDPELYTSGINYYFSYSMQENISIDQDKKGQEAFQLTDSTGQVAGYMNATVGFNPAKVDKAMQYANTGIQKFPDRLDIRFGKCYMLQQLGAYEQFTKEVIATVNYSQVNHNQWLWTENKPQKDGADFLLSTVQAYLKQLYDTEDDNLLTNIIEIGEATLKLYPDHIEILSTTAVALLLTRQYDPAIAHLKHAETLNPTDFIVLNNIAQAYKLNGDKANAIAYYEKTEKYGDDRAKQQAKENIKALKQ